MTSKGSFRNRVEKCNLPTSTWMDMTNPHNFFMLLHSDQDSFIQWLQKEGMIAMTMLCRLRLVKASAN